MLNFRDLWEDHLHLVEFIYNNNYQVSVKMVLFELSYGGSDRSMIYQDDTGERKLLEPEMIIQIVDNIN